MSRTPSFTFAGGVLSKGLWGRVDLQKYETGLKFAPNFQVAIEGGVEKRFGFYFIGKRKFQDKPSRLIPWRIANNDSYMLEFGENYIRFIRFGGYVSIPGGWTPDPRNEATNVGGFMEVATPYTAEDVSEIKITYANDIMYITHPEYPPQELSRYSLYDWSFNESTFTPHKAPPTGLAAVYHNDTTSADNYDDNPVDTSYRISATMEDGTETLASPIVTILADTGHTRCYVVLTWTALAGATQYTVYKGKNGLFGFIGYVNNATLTTPKFKLRVNAVSSPQVNTSLISYSSTMATLLADIKAAIIAALPKPFGQSAFNGGSVTSPSANKVRVQFPGTGLVALPSGFTNPGNIPITKVGSNPDIYELDFAAYPALLTPGFTFTDRNFAPSYDVVPIGDQYSWPAGEFPRVSEFYKQRKAYASSVSNPQRLIFSKPLLFDSLYHSIPQQDDDAIDMTIVGRERHTINHMVELKKFIIFTDTAEWVLSTDNNAPLTIATANPTKETSYGAHPDLRPIPISDRILFIQNTTKAIRDLGYEFTTDAFKADDLSRLSRDLFKNKDFVAWDYSAFPGNFLPCAMSDGTMNVCAYAREHEIWGWTPWSTKGKFIDVASVVELNENAIYVQTERTINGVKTYFIERQAVNFDDRIENMVYSDCALSFYQAKDFTALTRLSDTSASFTLASSGYITGTELQLEIQTVDGWEIIRAEVVSVAGSTVYIKPKRQDEFPEEFADSIGSAYLCTDFVTGFDHLIGEDIWVLADGKVFKELSIAGDGSITLPIKAARIHAGLPYDGFVETLNIDLKNTAGLYLQGTADEVVINLRNSRGVYVQASQADSSREPVLIEPRNDENMYDANLPLDGPYEVPTHVGFGLERGIRILSSDPLPCNILNIVPNVEYQ